MSLQHILAKTAARKAGKTPSPPAKVVIDPCVHRGDSPIGKVLCKTCGGKVELKVFPCQVFGECTPVRKADGIQCCKGCRSRVEPITHSTPGGSMKTVKWSYAVTTVPGRRTTLLPRTLQSLANAGFDKPRLFVDGCADPGSWEKEFRLEVTGRHPKINAYANWMLCLVELFLRDPNADRYAIFQDDLVTYRNLRSYLNKCPFPEKGYWNLYTFPWEPVGGRSKGRQAPPPRPNCGWYESNQRGRGALGLVFSREGITTLLSGTSSDFLVRKTMSVATPHKNIDGGVSEALSVHAGFKEYIHDPSLVQHTGFRSEIGNRAHPTAPTFRGEDFDAMDLWSPAHIREEKREER